MECLYLQLCSSRGILSGTYEHLVLLSVAERRCRTPYSERERQWYTRTTKFLATASSGVVWFFQVASVNVFPTGHRQRRSQESGFGATLEAILPVHPRVGCRDLWGTCACAPSTSWDIRGCRNNENLWSRRTAQAEPGQAGLFSQDH